LKSFVLAAIGEEVSTFAIEKAPSRAISITVLLIASQQRAQLTARVYTVEAVRAKLQHDVPSIHTQVGVPR
jgi:hypothetical protein